MNGRGSPRLFTLAAATGGLFGYLIAVSNDALAFVRVEHGLTPLGAATVVSSLVAGALPGCILAGTLADRIGRRYSLMGAAVLAMVGIALSALSNGLWLMVAGRLLAGVAVGVTSTVTPLYLAELAPYARRGVLLTCYQLFITLGIVGAFGVGLLLTPSQAWRWMFAAGAAFAVAQLVAAIAVPASPRFLVRRGQVAEARRSLERLRPADEVDEELIVIVASATDATAGSYRQLLGPRFRPGFVVGLVMALMNALVGVGAVIYYSTDVFRIAGVGGETGAQIASLAVGGVNTLAAVLSIWLTSRYGRRPLLSVGLLGIFLCLVTAGVTLVLPVSSSVGAVTVAAILAYMAFFAISAGPLAWLLLSEVMPGDVRAPAAAVATAANWAANLLITLMFPVVAGDPGVPWRVGLVFLFFAVATLLFFVFVRRRVPETKDRTLEMIEAELRRGDRVVS